MRLFAQDAAERLYAHDAWCFERYGRPVKRVQGGLALRFGPGSPVNQVVGLGPFDPGELARFFEGDRFDVRTLPFDGGEGAAMLAEAGYRPDGTQSVLFREATPLESEFEVREVSPAVWAEAAGREVPDFADVFRAQAGVEGFRGFHAFDGGEWAGWGALTVSPHADVLHGGFTLPTFRGRGVQRALLAARVSAVGEGWVTTMASPGSPSHRNAERMGFRVAATETRWRRP